MARKPSVNTNPVANQYAGHSERIVEYSYADGSSDIPGGLISLRWDESAGILSVHLYRHDPKVRVTVNDSGD